MALKDVWTLCEAHDYPTTASELATENEEETINHPGGRASFTEALEASGETTFENANEAANAVYGSLPASSVGRIGYSDRDPTPMGVGDGEPKSF